MTERANRDRHSDSHSGANGHYYSLFTCAVAATINAQHLISGVTGCIQVRVQR